MDNEDNGIGFTSSTPETTSEGTLSFGSESPGVPEDAVTNRAAKYSFALGNDSPGQEEVAHQLASGQEDLVRKHQMAVNQLQFEQQKSQMITNLIHNSPEGIDADSADFVRGLQESDYKENPNNVMETTYARKFISSIAQRDDQRNLAAAEALHPEYAHQVLDVGEQAVARNEIVHRELENIRGEKKQQGVLSAVADFAAANLLPLASLRLRNLVSSSPATSLLPGSNMQEQIGYLRSLDSDQFETQFTSALKSIPNLDLREQFATAVLQQSDSDAAMTNINALGDIATVAQIGAAPLKGLVKGIVGSETHAGLAGVVRSAVTASKATDVSAARIAATTGDFKEASVLNMLRETTPGIPPLLGEEEIRNKAFSINGAGQRWFTGDGPNLAGPNVRDFLDMAKKNEQLAGNFLLESPSVDRTTPEVRAAVGRELYEREIAGRDGSLSNAVLDIDSSGNLLNTNEPPKGYTRYYTADKTQGYIVPDAEFAKNFEKQKAAGNVHYVDIPDELFKGTTLEGKPTAFEAPKDILDKLKPFKFERQVGDKFATHLNPLTNTESITIRVGRKNGEQFPNKASAVKFAKDNFGLLKFNDTQFVSTGGKWHIRLDLDVPDHIDNLKEIEIPANDRMSQGFLDGMLGGLLGRTRNQSNILGDSINRARMVVVHGNQKLFKVFKDMSQPIVDLNGKERNRLGQILEANRDFVDRSEPGEANRGKFFSSRQEFEEAYHGKFGILPNQKEIKAYYSYVQLNQLDGMVRNAGWARDRIRLGIHKWNDRFWETKKSTNPESLDGTKRVPHDVELHGKQVFSIPEDEHETAIAIRNSATGDIQIVKNKRFMGDKQRALLKKELDGKAVIIQAEDGHLTVPTPDGDVTVSHYVTATSKRSRVGINGPWKDGGHVINEHEWYVKQPIYKGNYYAGDLAVATARDEATAKQRALAFKTARDMMLRGDPNLDRYVSENIGNGWNGKAFAEQFGGQKTSDGVVRQGLDVGGDFLHTRAGERTIDRHKTGLKHGENPYNIIQMDRTFSGERDATNIPALMDEKGVRHIFEDGRVLDPWAALSKAAQSMTNVKLKRDYILKSAQLWTHQFRDILEGSNDKLRNDAVTQLYQPSYLRSIDKVLLSNAENARRSIVRFAGSSNKEEQAFDTLHSKLSEIANAHLGPKANSVVSSKLLPFVKNPAQAAKSLAYTLHLGLLSPTQIFMQAQSLVNVLSISPRAGLKGVAAYYPLRAAMISPELFEHSVGSAAKLGWNADHYREMAEGMFRSGWHFVHGDQAILDTIESPKIFAGKVNKMIDWGNTFVTEGVRAHRLPAYATAYQEWRWANPTGKFDRAVEHTILKRADDLSANMSAANNATWQRGLASVPMQFATFPIRLMEGYFGKSLTLAEKGRLFAGYSMFYGIPTAVGGVVGVYPAYECVKNYLLENNIPHDDAVAQAVINGLPQLALRTLTGVNVDVGKRFGQGGIDVVQEGLALAGFDPGHLILNGDKNLFDLATGAAGSTLQDLVSTSVPFVKALWSSTVDNPKDNIYPLDTTTIERAVRNVTSANSVVKLWYALNTGRWMSKYDMVQDEVTPLEGVMMGLTGANLERIDDIFAEKGVLAGRKNLADKAALEVQDYLRRGFGFEDDDKQRQQYITIAKAHAVAGGLTEEEWRECLRAALRATVETQKDAMARRLQRDSFRRGLNN